MPKLSTRTARKMARARKTHSGGRPRKPTACSKCSTLCASARAAQAHCLRGPA